MRTRITALVTIALLGALAWGLPRVRRSLIHDVTTADAAPAEPAPLPMGTGPGLGPTPRTRVVLIDGLTAEMARKLPTWTRLCSQGMTLGVEVGFPTISLPVELALWTGLTQQQTGMMFRSGRPLDPPLDRRGIPAQIAGSWAVAESHGWIVRSLGFSKVEPPPDPANPGKDADAKAWDDQWQAHATEAVTSASALVFVHILRVDVAGHRHGLGTEYEQAALSSDQILGSLFAADPAARWFLLSDHGHIPTGGHGGEEIQVRHVQGCIAGPGVAIAKADLVHIVDVARALADSTGATLDPASRARPISVALTQPLGLDQAIPSVDQHRGVLVIFLLVAGLGAVTWGVRRWWLAPWWFVLACASLVVVRGVPTLSMPMIYKPEGRDMYLTWLPSLVIAFVATWIGLRRTALGRVIVAQLAVPITAAAAVVTASGAWSTVFGADIAPVVPRFTAWMSPLLLIAAHGGAAVALGVLAHLVHGIVRKRDATGNRG